MKPLAARPHAMLNIVVLIIVMGLCQVLPSFACPPSKIGLERQIQWAHQALVVEIVDIRSEAWDLDARYTDPDAWPWWLHSKDDLNADGTLTEHVREHLEDHHRLRDYSRPELGSTMEVVEAKVLKHLNPQGPQVGRTFHFFYNEWMHRGMVPGWTTFLFVRAQRPEYTIPAMPFEPVTANDSVMSIPPHQNVLEMEALIQEGFAIRNQPKPQVPTIRDLKSSKSDVDGEEEPDYFVDWRLAALQSPTVRDHLWFYQLSDEMQRPALTEALLSSSAGSRRDIDLLRNLAEYEDEDLDQWVLDWMESVFEAGIPELAVPAWNSALKRWGAADVEERFAAVLTAQKQDLEPCGVRRWPSLAYPKALPRWPPSYIK